MANQPKTAQGWAWYYIRNRLETVIEALKLTENLPNVTTFADVKEGEFFIRFPWLRLEDGKLVFKNNELYRKIGTVKRVFEHGGPYSAMSVTKGSFKEIPNNEPVLVIK